MFLDLNEEPEALVLGPLHDGRSLSLVEGRVEVEAELSYRIPEDRVLDLHRLHGPGYEAGWLSDLLRKDTSRRIASVSYDLVRNRAAS